MKNSCSSSWFLFYFIFLFSFCLYNAVNIGYPKEAAKEIQNFLKHVNKARTCEMNLDCTTHEFHKLGNGRQTFDSAKKTKFKSLILKSKIFPYCNHGIGQCLICLVKKGKVISENKLCRVKYKDPQPPQFLFDPELNYNL